MKNANEIKAAWNTFKKEAKKELSFGTTGCCYMNAKQLANGTATIFLLMDVDYDKDIDYNLRSIERVNAYTTWTEEEKKRNEEYHLRLVEIHKAHKATYGTPANEAKAKTEEVLSSKAYAKLAAAIDLQSAELELVSKGRGVNGYQIRFNF